MRANFAGNNQAESGNRASSTFPSQPSRAPRILLLTPYTGGNLGDAAIQDATIYHLRKRLDNPAISLVTLSPSATSRLHGVPSFPIGSKVTNDPEADVRQSSTDEKPRETKAGLKMRLKRSVQSMPWFYRSAAFLLRPVKKTAKRLRFVLHELDHICFAQQLLAQTDILILSGGGQIDDYWGGAGGHPYAMFKWALLAKLAGAPVAFLSVGVGSLRSQLSQYFGFQALQIAVHRSYRDLGSKELLQRAAFTHADPLYPDLAFSYTTLEHTALSLKDSDQRSLVVGISPITLGRLSHYGSDVCAQYFDRLSQFTGELLDQGHSVVLFSTALMDLGAVRDLHLKLSQDPRRQSWGDRLRQINQTRLTDQLAELQRMDIVVASRLHGIILSHVLGKPSLALSYERKVQAHMEIMGQERFCLDFHNCTIAQLTSGFAALNLESSAISSALNAKASVFSLKLDQQYDRVVSLLTASMNRVA